MSLREKLYTERLRAEPTGSARVMVVTGYVVRPTERLDCGHVPLFGTAKGWAKDEGGRTMCGPCARREGR